MKILSLLVCCVGLIGCMKDPLETKHVNVGTHYESKIVFYSQNVYYFEYVGADFGNALASFLITNSELEVAGIANHINANGAPKGYFVVFRPKKKC